MLTTSKNRSWRRVRPVLFAALTAVLCTPAAQAKEPATPRLVWHVQIVGDSLHPVARLLVNEFARPGGHESFPLREVPVRRFADSSGAESGRISPSWWVTAALLRVAVDGQLADSVLQFSEATGFENWWQSFNDADYAVEPIHHAIPYGSANGHTVVELARNPARLQLYEVSRTGRPKAIGRSLEAPNEYFDSAAVSDHGHTIAVQAFDRNDPEQILKVRLYDRRLRQRSILPDGAREQGIRFQGRYLFVGFPVSFAFWSTKDIWLFDVGSR